MGCAFVVYAGGSTRKNDALRFQGGDFIRRQVEPDDFGVNLAFPNPAGDYLRILRTEIENEDFTMGRGRCSFHDYG